MKRSLISLLLAVQALCLSAQYRTPAYGDLQDSETVTAFKEHVSYLASAALEGRAAGSEGETDAAKYVGEVLSRYGVDVISGPEGDIFGMKQASGDTLVSRNVIGFVQGYDEKLRDRYIVIGARLDNIGTRGITVDGEKLTRIYYGANGNASGIAMMLELARRIQTNALLFKRSVLFVAFGASLESNAGSWYFLNRSFSADVPSIDAMIDLDMLGGGRGFYAYTSSNADMNQIVHSLGSTLQPLHPELVAKEPFPSDHRAFYDREIPSVLFTTGIFPEYGTDRDTPSTLRYDDMEREMEYIYNYAASLINGPKPVFNPNAELQRRREEGGSDVVPYYECDYKPTFLGSNDPKVFLEKWVYAYVKYPKAAVENGIQGRVLVDFIIDEKGKVGSVKVLKSAHPLLDDEAVKVISASPDWKPGRLNGKKVKSEISLYVEFRLERRK